MATSELTKLLVTGATGTIGKELCKILSAKGVPYKAMVRSVARAQNMDDLAGAELVTGDFNDSESLKSALTGVERAFLLTNSSEQAEQQQIRFVDIAQEAGVKHIVKLSQWAADAESPVRFLRYHAAVEAHIHKSGMLYTFLRPNLFMQGLLGFRDSIRFQGQFYGAIGDAKISIVDVRDIAAAAAAALTDPRHENQVYALTGPEALSHHELADTLSAVLGYSVTFIDLTSEMLEEMLLKVGFPTWQAEGLVEDYAHYKKGEASEVAPGIMDATGTAPRTFSDFAKDHAALFRP
ncbi:SDR family oxidoreductase [Dyadobacter chenhuakuii]|uniref:SDR family oxidoreductase n=1 Tax=Dyadobacter chenhuakuii TaxID=2909339 RepID=A0ABY4XRE3_9BACT|nr:SDR family oxidoreductase [Dyadobacter chenhuakuii]MCF2492909.1 SDR family oxidoreductase [Dyadobacter chenhuakuii]USJ32801.1 SDR family oxidoreductase [Dyadobacter chenhuakuii]